MKLPKEDTGQPDLDWLLKESKKLSALIRVPAGTILEIFKAPSADWFGASPAARTLPGILTASG